MRDRVTTVDVVVIGAGVVGLFVARKVALRGLSVLLLDSGGVCSGTSGSSTGHITTTSARRPMIRQLAREGLSEWFQTVAELECGGLTPIDTLVCARSEPEVTAIKELYDSLKADGIDCELNAEPVREFEGVLAATAFVRVPGEASVDVPAVGRHLASSLPGQGGRFDAFARVDQLSCAGNELRVNYAGATVSAPHVVVCAGVWTNTLLRSLGASLPVTPRKGHVALLSGAAHPDRLQVTELSYLLTTAPEQDSELVVAADVSLSSCGAQCGSSREYTGYDTAVHGRTLQQIVDRCMGLLPALKEHVLVGGFAGLRPATPDGLPFIDKLPGCPGVIVATGHEGYGHTLAPVTAELVATLITEPKAQPPPEFSIERLHELEPAQP